jgi:hypothetical protein
MKRTRSGAPCEFASGSPAGQSRPPSWAPGTASESSENRHGLFRERYHSKFIQNTKLVHKFILVGTRIIIIIIIISILVANRAQDSQLNGLAVK